MPRGWRYIQKKKSEEAPATFLNMADEAASGAGGNSMRTAASWSVEEVQQWLKDHDFAEFTAAFLEEGIAGPGLLRLGEAPPDESEVCMKVCIERAQAHQYAVECQFCSVSRTFSLSVWSRCCFWVSTQ